MGTWSNMCRWWKGWQSSIGRSQESTKKYLERKGNTISSTSFKINKPQYRLILPTKNSRTFKTIPQQRCRLLVQNKKKWRKVFFLWSFKIYRFSKLLPVLASASSDITFSTLGCKGQWRNPKIVTVWRCWLQELMSSSVSLSQEFSFKK